MNDNRTATYFNLANLIAACILLIPQPVFTDESISSRSGKGIQFIKDVISSNPEMRVIIHRGKPTVIGSDFPAASHALTIIERIPLPIFWVDDRTGTTISWDEHSRRPAYSALSRSSIERSSPSGIDIEFHRLWIGLFVELTILSNYREIFELNRQVISSKIGRESYIRMLRNLEAQAWTEVVDAVNLNQPLRKARAPGSSSPPSRNLLDAKANLPEFFADPNAAELRHGTYYDALLALRQVLDVSQEPMNELLEDYKEIEVRRSLLDAYGEYRSNEDRNLDMLQTQVRRSAHRININRQVREAKLEVLRRFSRETHSFLLNTDFGCGL